jgi:hypothetical protein
MNLATFLAQTIGAFALLAGWGFAVMIAASWLHAWWTSR